jgi:hypothetical protein
MATSLSSPGTDETVMSGYRSCLHQASAGMGIACEMLFDFPDRMLGQVLVYLGNDACFHVGVECVPQISKSPWRSNYDEGFYLPRSDHLFQSSGYLSREMVLLNIVPIGWLDSASAAHLRSLANVPRTLGPLLVGGWIFILKNLLGLEIRKFLVAIISQEQGFSAIADKHECIMRNLELVHVVLVTDLFFASVVRRYRQ